jgi:hypothetical protein
MLDPRVYRAAFVPALLAMVLVAFSLVDRPRGIQTTLAPDAFDGDRAFARLEQLVSAFPDRRPGSAGDQRLAGVMANDMRRAGFSVTTRTAEARTIDGKQTLTTVTGTRTGVPGPGIVVVAHRDAAGHGAEAELSGTAALDELVQVYAGRSTRRTLTLVSTSGGSGGAASAADLAGRLRPADTVLVLGDLASKRLRKPWVLPWSEGSRLAPVRLRRTLESAVRAETGQDPGAPRATTQLARLAFPFALGEEGRFNERGIPAVALQASGERGPAAGAPVSAARLRVFGRAALRTIAALDKGPPLRAAPSAEVVTMRKLLPEWSVRLLVGALLLPAALAALDGLARVRRRREPVAVWGRWLAALAAPFAIAALVTRLLGAAGIVDAPGAPVPAGDIPLQSGALIAIGLVFVLAWVCVRPLERAMGVRGAPEGSGPAAALAVATVAIAALVWLRNPYAAGVLVLPVHAWLLGPELRASRTAALALVLVALIPAGLVLGVYASALGLAAGDLPWSLLLLVAGGHVGVLSLIVLCALCGCGVAAARLALRRARDEMPAVPVGHSVRGPMGYAGPGSLGGTESGLRLPR